MKRIAFEIPTGIKPPKFSLFERVSLADRDDSGYIVGIWYLTPVQSLLLGLTGYGWRYEVTNSFGMTAEQAAECSDVWTIECPERSISACDDEQLAA